MNYIFLNFRLENILRTKGSLWVRMFLLSITILLNTVTIHAATIVGNTNVCINDTSNYTIGLPTSGLSYLWGPVTSLGTATGYGTPTLTVNWIASGIANIRAYGVDTTGDTIETLVRSVVIRQPSIPGINTNYRVACQELTGRGGPQPRPPGILDTSKCLLVCAGATATYYGKGSPGSIFDWSATGAVDVIPMDDSCIVIWGNAGAGTLTIYETNSYGCIGSATYCFDILEKPLANFQTYAIYTNNNSSSANIVHLCMDDYLIFKDNSTGSATSPIMSCYWDFGDGTYSTTASPTTNTHQYKTPGNYTAMLVVENACGCTDTARLHVEVRPEKGAYITCPSLVCEGEVSGYKVHDYVSCGLFNWSVIGGTIISPMPYTDSIMVRWDNVDASGFGYVMFDASSCGASCNGSSIVKIPVIKNRGNIIGPDVICIGEPAMYRMPMWPTTRFNWNTASPSTTLDSTEHWNEVVVTANTPGTIVLRTNYKNTLLGCGGVAYDTITVLNKLTVLGSGKYCEGTHYTWSLSSPSATGDWVLIRPDATSSTLTGSNSFTALLDEVGRYKVYVEGVFCSIDTIFFDVTSKPPKVDGLFGPDRACPDVPTKYEAKSPLGGYMFGWAVDVGTVSPPSADAAWAKFTGTGPWEIKTWRSDLLGCPSDTLRKSVLNPIVPVTISGSEYVCGSSRHNYEVDYLDGETYDWEIWNSDWTSNYIGSVTLPTDSSFIGVTWNNTRSLGAEIAYLVVRVRKCGIYMMDTLIVNVNAAPPVTISGPPTICSGQEAVFTASSTPPISSVFKVVWSFGDGSTGESYPNAIHRYNTTGATTTTTYMVTLTVEGPNGCARTLYDSTTIDVLPQPVLRIGDINGDKINHCNEPTWVNELGPLPGSSTGTYTYEWKKAGVTLGTSSILNINETLWGTGDYKLYVTDVVNGCVTEAMVEITDTCTTCTSATMPTPIVIADQSCGLIEASGGWTPSAWGFNPTWKYIFSTDDLQDIYNVETTDYSFRANYRFAGLKRLQYTVSYLTGTDTCTTTKDTSILIPYVADLGGQIKCNTGTHVLHVYDITTTYLSTPLRLFYIDGVLHTSTFSSGTIFSVPSWGSGSGVTITLKVVAPGYDTCIKTMYVEKPPTVTASFTIPRYNPACIDDAVVEFTNTSTMLDSTWKAHWDYGDTSTNNLWSPWKIYGNNFPIDKKPVTLTITDRFGCYATFTDTVKVVDNELNGAVEAFPTISCSGSMINLSYNPIFPALMADSFRWNDGTRFIVKNGNATRNVYDPGAYWVWATDAYGCNDKTPTTVVDVEQISRPVIAGDIAACAGSSYTLYYPAAAYPTGATYTWLQNGVVVHSSGSPTHSFSNIPGTYTYRLIITISGTLTCSDTSDPFIVTVYPHPMAPTASYSVLSCNDYEVALSASSSSAGVFNWSSGDEGSPVIVNSGGPYRVWLTDAHGCASFTDITVPHNPDVYAYVLPVGCYDLCVNDAPFELLGPKHPASFSHWAWLLNGMSTSSGVGAVTGYSITTPGSYDLMLENTPCRDTFGALNINFIDCPAGCLGSAEFMGATKNMAGTMCYDTLLLIITCPPGTTYTMSADNGTVLPGTGTGPTPGIRKFRYIANPGFIGPADFIKFVFTNPVSGISCSYTLPIFVTSPCPNSMARSTTEENEEVIITEALSTHLRLSPNPASQSVQLQYGFSAQAMQRSIEVYDMMGKCMYREAVIGAASGNKILSLKGYAPGLYIVLLREDEHVLYHSKLHVIE